MKILILASGRGSNARAVMEAAASGKIRAEVCALFSDVADAPALSIAREFSVPARFIDPGRPGARLSPEGEAAYIEAMREVRADLVVLAGFMTPYGARSRRGKRAVGAACTSSRASSTAGK